MGEVKNIELFNSPLETALRTLLIVNKMKKVSLDGLIIYDYLCLNTNDFNGPSSIQPPIPNRNVQILIRREVIKEGLKILVSKELVDVKFMKGGIFYSHSKLTKLFLEHMNSEYKSKVQDRVDWVHEQFAEMSESKLKKFVFDRIENWENEITSQTNNTSN